MPHGDLIVVDENNRAFLVKRDRWMRDDHRIENDVVGDAAVLVKRGALVADVPEPDVPVGYYCFLINLAQLKNPVSAGAGPADADSSAPLGQDGLIIHTADDSYFILRGEEWRTEEYTGEFSPSSGIICADVSDGFVANLPLFTTP